MAHGFTVDSSDVERSLNRAQTPKYSEHQRGQVVRHSEGAIALPIPPSQSHAPVYSQSALRITENEAEQAGLFVTC